MKALKSVILIIALLIGCLFQTSCAYNRQDERGEWEGSLNTLTAIGIGVVALLVGQAAS